MASSRVTLAINPLDKLVNDGLERNSSRRQSIKSFVEDVRIIRRNPSPSYTLPTCLPLLPQ